MIMSSTRVSRVISFELNIQRDYSGIPLARARSLQAAEVLIRPLDLSCRSLPTLQTPNKEISYLIPPEAHTFLVNPTSPSSRKFWTPPSSPSSSSSSSSTSSSIYTPSQLDLGKRGQGTHSQKWQRLDHLQHARQPLSPNHHHRAGAGSGGRGMGGGYGDPNVRPKPPPEFFQREDIASGAGSGKRVGAPAGVGM